jgi:hypothetical protein
MIKRTLFILVSTCVTFGTEVVDDLEKAILEET